MITHKLTHESKELLALGKTMVGLHYLSVNILQVVHMYEFIYFCMYTNLKHTEYFWLY